MNHAPHATGIEILTNAIFSDSPELMQINRLDKATQRHIANARLYGYTPISVRWPVGQFALMFCEPGSQWPNPQKVVTAYRQCLQTSKVFPEGT